MKRRTIGDGSYGGDQPIDAAEESGKKKKRKIGGDGGGEEAVAEGGRGLEMGEDLLFEVLRHADARTLARAACVSRQWRTTAEDERLWEGVCTRQWANTGCGVRQLRSVVLALGGFRRLHSLYLLPLLKPSQASSASSPFPHPLLPISSSSLTRKAAGGVGVGSLPARWGKDEVHLSLSLLSIRYYYDQMNLNK